MGFFDVLAAPFTAPYHVWNALDNELGTGAIPDANVPGGLPKREAAALAPGERPGRPMYQPSYDPRTMGISDELNGRLNGIQMDKRGLNKFRGEALRTGPSAWASLATRQQGVEGAKARQDAAKAGAGQAAEARSALAMKGGLRSGASERIARDSMRNQLAMGQQIGQKESDNKLSIGMNDEQNRVNQLGQLPGMEIAALQPEFDKTKLWGQGKQYDIGNRINETDKNNAFDLQRYHEEMQAWGANQQANATANSGKK